MATILIVDDDPISWRMLSYTLRKDGHTVATAAHGQLGLAALADTPCDLVISDLSMPEMDGVTLLRRLRADDRYRTLPVIMLTASGHDEDRHSARTEGVDEFLTKPTASRELIETVNRALESRQSQ